MYPARFRYLRTETVDEAVSALTELGSDARVLAGGASLIPWMKYRQVRPAAIIDIGSLDELRGFARRDDRLTVGALTTHAEAAEDEELAHFLPILRDVAASIGDPQVRNMGTIGGGVAAAELTGDWGPALIALDGSVIVRGRDGEREIRAEELFVDTLRTTLAADELLTHITVPLPQARSGSSHVKFMLRAVTALGSCSVAMSLDDRGQVASIGIGLGGIGPVPVAAPEACTLLRGQVLNAEVVEEAKHVATDTLPALSDARTSAAHRRQVAGELVARALSGARARVVENGAESGGKA